MGRWGLRKMAHGLNVSFFLVPNGSLKLLYKKRIVFIILLYYNNNAEYIRKGLFKNEESIYFSIFKNKFRR